MLKGKYKVPAIDASYVYRTCTRKQKFVSEIQANKFIRLDERGKLHVYPCRVCQFFHIGHINLRLQNAIIKEKENEKA